MSDRTGNARVKQSDSDERMRLAVDLQLKRAELALRRLEIAGKKRETSIVRSAAASPLMLARFGGIITVIGGIGADYYQAARALEF